MDLTIFLIAESGITNDNNDPQVLLMQLKRMRKIQVKPFTGDCVLLLIKQN